MSTNAVVDPSSGEVTIEGSARPVRPILLAAGAGLVAHGLAHMVGALGMWGVRTEDGRLPDGLLLDPSGVAAGVMGALWCLAVVAFVLVGVGVLRGRPSRPGLAGTAAYSLVLCVLAMPTAVVGLAIDVVVLLGVLVAVVRGRSRR